MPAFIGATYFRNFVFLGIVAKDLERAHVRAHAATNAFGPVDDWGHIRFLLSKTVFSEVGHHEMLLCVLSFTTWVSATIAYATKRKKARHEE